MSALFAVDTPYVFKDKIHHWPASSWTPEKLANFVAGLKTKFRIGSKSHSNSVVWESDCQYEEATFSQFVEWLKTDVRSDNPLRSYDPRSHWCYADYNYMKELFANCSNLIEAVDWSAFGFTGRDGKDSTFWMGSEGAHTPCHYDTYGCNLVAQIYGRKRWILFSPEQTSFMYPTRIPYEESSVFSEINVGNPDMTKYTKFRHTTPYIITLEPGDVLYVPRHWWHYVYSLETSISVNTWLEIPEDDEMRLQEAVTRMLVCSLMKPVAESIWLNPTEEAHESETNVQYLQIALNKLKENNKHRTPDKQQTSKGTSCVVEKEAKTKKLRIDDHKYFKEMEIVGVVEVLPSTFEEYIDEIRKTFFEKNGGGSDGEFTVSECNSEQYNEATNEKQEVPTKRRKHDFETHCHRSSDNDGECRNVVKCDNKEDILCALTKSVTNPSIVYSVYKLLRDNLEIDS